MADTPEVTSLDPVDLIAAGRRSLAVKDYPSAVNNLAGACELLAARYGDQADECGEAYLWYGKALLGLSREESGVFGDGIPGSEGGENDGDNGDGEACGDESDEDNEVEGLSESKSENRADSESTKDKTEVDSESTKLEEPSTATSVLEEQKDIPSDKAEADELEERDDDEVENLQIAWETLDLARSILSKRTRSDEDARALLAEVHLLLGEVALESETYDKAVIDMEKCLELQKELYNGDDRKIAETHYQIGLANSLASNFEDAVLHFRNAVNILEARIRTLETPHLIADDPTVKKYTAADPFYSVAGEIKELKELLPEIQEKIQDMLEYKAEAIKAVRAQLCPSTNGEGPSTSSSSAAAPAVNEFPLSSTSTVQPKQASDISHLIKRKRTSSQSEEASTGDAVNPAKKPNL